MVRVEERCADLLEKSERCQSKTSRPNCIGWSVQVIVQRYIFSRIFLVEITIKIKIIRDFLIG